MSEQSVRQGPRSCNLFCQKRKKYHLPTTFSQKHTRIVTLKKETIFTGVGDIHCCFGKSVTTALRCHTHEHGVSFGIGTTTSFTKSHAFFCINGHASQPVITSAFRKSVAGVQEDPQPPCDVLTLWTLSWGRRILGGCSGVPRGCCKSRLKSPWVS